MAGWRHQNSVYRAVRIASTAMPPMLKTVPVV
jgi:hypothetical protein